MIAARGARAGDRSRAPGPCLRRSAAAITSIAAHDLPPERDEPFPNRQRADDGHDPTFV